MRRSLIALLSVIGVVSAASAEISLVVFECTATSSAGSSTWQFVLPEPPPEGDFSWVLDYEVVMQDQTNGNVIGVMKQASIQYIADPQVNLNFLVTAGSVDTDFTITSGLLSFSGINPADARASAAVTVTDNDGDGALLLGNHGPDGKAFRSFYNGLVPGAGTEFVSLVSSVAAGPFDTNDVTENVPFTNIGGPITSMSTQLKFNVSANDDANGTTNFEVIPEPGTFALLGLAVVGLLRRR